MEKSKPIIMDRIKEITYLEATTNPILRHGSLFSGIGGFDLAAEWMGWENVFHCEWNEFGKKVLKHYWPNAISYNDITKTDFTIHRGQIDILTGGFPCQPYSVAGKRKGKEDERHLWPEMLRAIREITPRYIVGENVSGLLSWDGGLVFNEVQADLEAEGYEVQPVLLPACAIGGWHRRDRVWFIAHSIDSTNSTNGRQKGKEKGLPSEHRKTGCSGELIGTDNTLHTNDRSELAKRSCEKTIPKLRGIQRGENGRVYANIEGRPDLSTPVLCRSYDGIPSGVDRVTAYGNAIVPQVAFQIFKALMLAETKQPTNQ
jgi:DNA (cytosine-5)-methyltransferase 1